MIYSPEFLAVLAGRPSGMQLDEAALQIAALDHEGVDPARWLGLLDGWAGQLMATAGPATSGPLFLSRLNAFFFGELGFRGDSEDYHHPANSCLDQVLERRKGLPITLSVAYLELARRLKREVSGVALPAHFLCRYVEEGIPIYIDVFHAGRLMTEEDCVELISQAAGQALEFDPSAFPAATPRVILHRMLNNLRNSYSLSGRFQDVERLERLQRGAIQEAQD
jgi:regulator of sirC expression with transglutaminase-like and TPR domain